MGIGIQPKMLDPDLDPYKMKADPQPCLESHKNKTFSLENPIFQYL
jgi:hypothetical protein